MTAISNHSQRHNANTLGYLCNGINFGSFLSQTSVD